MNKQKLQEHINKLVKEFLSEEIVFDISKNTQVAPYMGAKFGQDVEPKGTYVVKCKSNIDEWVNGKAALKNPLYINVNDNNMIDYKRELASKYKAKGANLTKKLMSKGYDANNNRSTR